MEIPLLKEKLQEYINTGDEKLLQMLYEMAVGYDTDGDEDEISAEDLAVLEERRKSRLNGESETYDLETAKAMISHRK